MKLSFVIPAYNEEAILGSCLESIFREHERKNYEIEVIVVNNASTDKTREVAESFRGVKIVDEPTKGLVQARQAGFMASDGDLIANVDADTMLTPGWIERAFEEFSKDDQLVALSGPFFFYDLPKFSSFVSRMFFHLGSLTHMLNQHVFHRGAVLQGGNYVLRRSALQKIGGYNMDLHFYGEDADVAQRVSKVGRVKFTFNFPIYASGRRLKVDGVIITGILSILDYLWVMFFKKPFRKPDNRDIRL